MSGDLGPHPGLSTHRGSLFPDKSHPLLRPNVTASGRTDVLKPTGTKVLHFSFQLQKPFS